MKFSRDPEPRDIELHIPIRTYLMLFAVIAMAAMVYYLAPVLLLVYLSLLIAITLTSLERVLMRHGWRKPIADTVLIISLLAVLSVILFVLIPGAVSQLKGVLADLPKLKAQLSQMVSPDVRKSANQIMVSSPHSLNRMWEQFGVIANNTLTGIFQFGIMMIVSFYMLLEGPKAYAWLLAFVPGNKRERVDQTAREIGPIVESYIVGQAITSTLAAVWVFTTAKILGVPAALTLGMLAAVFDILPGLGFPLNAVTGGLMALTVSPQSALIMIASLLVYMLLENYVLVPFIYGHRMKLSPLVVLISLIIAGTIGGIPAMIGVLPIVASYGPIEKYWLRRREDMKETTEIHRKLRGKTSEDLANPYHN